MHAKLPISANASDTADSSRLSAWCEARFGWVIAAILVLAAGIRLAVWREFWVENPFATFPTLDSALYWQRAGEMAAGAWWSGEPFHIAPLYTHALGLFRSLGGGLLALYGAQLVIHLATACGIAAAARLRFGALAGCLAAALFLGLGEPALFATRILGTTLQLALVSLLWWDWARLATAPQASDRHVIRVGVWIGLLALAFPAALLLVPAYAVWLIRFAPGGDGPRPFGYRRALLGAVAAGFVVAPASLHNTVATGEFIPVTTHAGITLAAGNGPGSAGIFTPIPETSGTVANQARESARAFEIATGRSGTWSEIDAYFRNRVVDWWRENPLAALALMARKAWWFATSRHYDNVTAFALEREYGLQDASAALPLEVPWLFGLVVVGFAATRRPRDRFLPEAALVVLPFVVCLLFMYSARYRVLATPVLCGVAAAAVAHWDRLRWPRAGVVTAILLPVPMLIGTALTGFGNLDFMREDFARLLIDRTLAASRAERDRGDIAAAEIRLRRAAAYSPDRTDVQQALALLYLESEQFERARATALEIVQRDPRDAVAHRLLYDSQIGAGDFQTAAITLDLVERLSPGNGEVQVAMAWFYAACPDVARRNPSRALHHARAAERFLGPSNPDAAMATTLAAASAGDSRLATSAARRGAASARERGDADLLAEFERLLGLVDGRRAIAARPRLLARR